MDQGITDRPRPPWELPGGFRRDCEPHRADLLLWLSGVSLLCCLAALVPCFAGLPALLGVPLGLTTWVLARRDLALMRKGLMDPGGEAGTRKALDDAQCAVILPLASALILALVLLALGVVNSVRGV
jgi:hypothetical protein